MMHSDTPGWRTDFDKEFTAARLLGLLGLLMLISYPDIVLGTHAFFYRDAGQFGYPVAYYLRDCFWRGEVPLWNPYNNCGIPFLAQWNTLALYPPSLFYVLFPMPWSMNYFILGHGLLAGAGMYFLALRWFGNRFAASVAGLAFAWNGFSVDCWMWPCLIAALAWMPWVVLLCERAWTEGRRAVIWAALAGACQMVLGSPEIIVFTWVIVGGNFLLGLKFQIADFKVSLRQAGRLAGVVVFVAALSAAQLMPSLDLLAHGDRSTATGDNAWAMPVWGAANFLAPLFRLTGSVTGVFMQADQQLTSSYYVGVVILLLALLAVVKVRNRRTLFLGVLVLGGVLCAMGDAGVLLKVLKMVMPGVGFARYPIKFVMVTVFALPLLAAAGVVWLHGQKASAVRGNLWTIAFLMAVTVLALSFWIPFPEDSRRLVGWNGAVRLFILAVGVGLIFWQPRFETRVGQGSVSCALLLLLGLDICNHMPRQNPTVPVSAYSAFSNPMTLAPHLGESRAMLSPEVETLMGGLVNSNLTRLYLGQREELYSDCNLLDKVPKVNGFFSIHLREESTVARLLYSDQRRTRLEEFLGVSQVSERLFDWQARTNFMPWATIGQQPVFAGDAETLNALISPDFAPRKEVYLPVKARNAVSAGADPDARILSSRVTAEEGRFQTFTATRTMMVVAQAYYHCWRASEDGVAVPVFRANHGFQAIEVPEGKHEVRLVYDDHWFQTGATISIAALAIGLAGLVWPKKSS